MRSYEVMADMDRERETERIQRTDGADLFRKTEMRDPHDPEDGEQLPGPLGSPVPDSSTLRGISH